MSRLLRLVDLPPIWLIGMLGIGYGVDKVLPGLGFGFGWSANLGTVLVVIGLALMGFAVPAFMRARTSIIPRRMPRRILTTGIYRLTRNPIYLGDALVLGGMFLRWDVLPALVLVPVFIRLITRRFILGEEAGLLHEFGEEFRDWAARVRRWL